MGILDIDSVFDLGKSVIDRIWPDPNKRAEELRKLEELRQRGDLAKLNSQVQLMLGQLEVNKVEASHKSIFVAGWRPAVGWVCVSILGFNYIGVYLLELISAYIEMSSLPARMDMSDLWPVLLGMLGIGGMRSYDKKNHVSTERI